jgi:hypothetical protein
VRAVPSESIAPFTVKLIVVPDAAKMPASVLVLTPDVPNLKASFDFFAAALAAVAADAATLATGVGVGCWGWRWDGCKLYRLA